MSPSVETGTGYRVRIQPDAGTCLVLFGPGLPCSVEAIFDPIVEALKTLEARDALGYIDFQVAVSDFLETAHSTAIEIGETARGPAGSAISLSLMRLSGKQYFLAHLGACRPLVYGKGIVHPLAREHTEASALHEQGKLRAQDIQRHPGVRRLTRGVGLSRGDPMEVTSAAFRKGTLHEGDRLLFPAGDLIAYLGDEGLVKLLRDTREPAAVLSGLVEAYQEDYAVGAVLHCIHEGSAFEGAATTGLLGTWSEDLHDELVAPEPAPPAPPPTEDSVDDEESSGCEVEDKAEVAETRVHPLALDPDIFPDEDLPDPPPPPVLIAIEGTPTAEQAGSQNRRVPGKRRTRRSRRGTRTGRRKERWVDVGPESRLEEPLVIGALLAAASLAVVGLLFWMYLTKTSVLP